MRFVSLLLLAVGVSVAQEMELQCKCRLLEGNEYLCKSVAPKGTAPSSTVVLPMPAATDAPVSTSATAAKQATETPKPTTVQGTPTGQTTSSGAPIYVGPRGGRYHYSSSGKKVYERRKP